MGFPPAGYWSVKDIFNESEELMTKTEAGVSCRRAARGGKSCGHFSLQHHEFIVNLRMTGITRSDQTSGQLRANCAQLRHVRFSMLFLLRALRRLLQANLRQLIFFDWVIISHLFITLLRGSLCSCKPSGSSLRPKNSLP